MGQRNSARLQTPSKPPQMKTTAAALRSELEAMQARHAAQDARFDWPQFLTSVHELIAETEQMLAEDRPQ